MLFKHLPMVKKTFLKNFSLIAKCLHVQKIQRPISYKYIENPILTLLLKEQRVVTQKTNKKMFKCSPKTQPCYSSDGLA